MTSETLTCALSRVDWLVRVTHIFSHILSLIFEYDLHKQTSWGIFLLTKEKKIEESKVLVFMAHVIISDQQENSKF